MKATLTISLALIFNLLVVCGCTDNRTPLPSSLTPQQLREARIPRLINAPVQTIVKLGDLRGKAVNGASIDISTYQMFTKGTSMYLTGAGNGAPALGFSKWVINAKPESPSVVFSVNEQLPSFTEHTTVNWRPDYYASGAITVVGPWAYLSGSLGMSVVDMSDTGHPKEKVRLPPSPDIEPVRDERFVYKALVSHPSLPILYGFREQDYQYTLSANGATVKILQKNPYGAAGENVCCVVGATVFQNKLYIAFTHALWSFKLAANGELGELSIDDSLQATGIASTNDALYVLHQPSSAAGANAAIEAGVYVLDATEQTAKFLPIQPIVFSVSQDNTHVYANMDGTSVSVYKINWEE